MSKTRMSDPAATGGSWERTADIERVQHFENLLLKQELEGRMKRADLQMGTDVIRPG